MQHSAIKSLHQFGRRDIIHLPKARHHAWRARLTQASRHSDQSFAFDIFPHSRTASAQNDQIGDQAKVVKIAFGVSENMGKSSAPFRKNSTKAELWRQCPGSRSLLKPDNP